MQAHPAIDTNGFYEALVGTLIAGRYELRQFIKVGGSSGVFDGLDRVMSRRIAVKMMPAGDPTMEHRFEREAQILSRLRHPNTLTVYDFGRAEKAGGTWLFMVMELLEGQSLKDMLRDEGCLPPRRAVRVVSQVCRSLWDAHRHGIVHRDIKPSNIFLVHVDDDPEFVKVLDFGVARLMSIREDPVDHDMTQSGRIIGTPRYMSPEQISSQPVDPRADIYSTGVMLYEMLTGRVPFEDATLGGLLILHLKEAPLPFDMLDFPYADDVSPPLEAAVMRALNKRPEDRFQAIEDLRVAIEEAVGMISPRGYADRRAVGGRGALADGDLGAVIPPPPLPADVVGAEDPEGIVLDDVLAPEAEPTHFLMPPRAPRAPSGLHLAAAAATGPRLGSSQGSVASFGPPLTDEPIEDAYVVDAPVPVGPSRRLGRWVAAAIFLALAATVTVTVAFPSGDVPRVQRMRAQSVALGGVAQGSLPSLAMAVPAVPSRGDEAPPLQLDPVPVMDAPDEPAIGGPAEVAAPDGAPSGADVVPVESVSAQVAPGPGGTEVEVVEELVVPLDLPREEPVAPAPPVTQVRKTQTPRPPRVTAPQSPVQPKQTAAPSPAPDKKSPDPAGSGENRPKAAESAPKAPQLPDKKVPEKVEVDKKAVVPLLDDLPAKPTAEPKTPRVASPVVPLLD